MPSLPLLVIHYSWGEDRSCAVFLFSSSHANDRLVPCHLRGGLEIPLSNLLHGGVAVGVMPWWVLEWRVEVW